jgi:hypothetical protein
MHFPESTLELIRKSVFYDRIIVSLELNMKCSQYNSYNSKVTILGICGLIASQIVFTDDEVLKLLNLVLSYLYRQKVEESKSLKISLMSDLDCNFVDDENSDDEMNNANRPRMLNDNPYQVYLHK